MIPFFTFGISLLPPATRSALFEFLDLLQPSPASIHTLEGSSTRLSHGDQPPLGCEPHAGAAAGAGAVSPAAHELALSGGLTADTVRTVVRAMRQHPDFSSEILQVIYAESSVLREAAPGMSLFELE